MLSFFAKPRNILVLGSISLVLICCKSKEEPLPVVHFGTSLSQIHEGDTVQLINESLNGAGYEWSIPALNFSSFEKAPLIYPTEAGNYTVHLKVKNGDGKIAEDSQVMSVLADTIYRLSKNMSKVWIVKSIVYSGSEMLTETCQKDDEFTVYYNGKNDTCTMTEGTQLCPQGTYLIELPTTSYWRYLSAKKTFEFALTAFGSPINLSFTTDELTHTSFKGTDSKNNVKIALEAKP